MDSAQYAAIRRRVEELYELTAAGQWGEVEKRLTEDFSIREAESLPFGGTFEGKDALRRLYGIVFGFWDEPSLEFHDMTISADHAVTLLTLHATSRRTGKRLAMRLAEVFHLRGDQISGITPYYFDTAEIAAAS